MDNKELIKEIAEIQSESYYDYTIDEFFIDWKTYKHEFNPEELVSNGQVKMGSMLSTIDVLLQIECTGKPQNYWYVVPNGLFRKN